MSNTSSRTLQLLSLLQDHRHWTGAELAERLEVSERTLRRDVERLRELGYPVAAQRGVDGGYQLTPGASLPPLVLDDEEAVALSVGLQLAVQASTIEGIAQACVRALTKIARVMPSRLRRQVDALAATTVSAAWSDATSRIDAHLLTTVAQACHDAERLEFDYTARDGVRSTRSVEPYRLVVLGRRWYLVAWDLTRHDWRSFRLDRLGSARGTGARCIPREIPTGDAVTFVRSGIEQLPTQYEVEVLVRATATVVRARVGAWANVEEVDDERCRMRMTTDSLDWPTMALGSLGAEFDVVTPPDLIAHLREWAGRFGRAAGVA